MGSWAWPAKWDKKQQQQQHIQHQKFGIQNHLLLPQFLFRATLSCPNDTPVCPESRRSNLSIPCHPDRQSKPVFKKRTQVRRPMWDGNLDPRHVEEEFVSE
ncbi:hypothetical protein CDAR_540501 [Caerostris darwini]|uniref:Uncharacterized protein n=1 Tax=Caerostris darwini TaxID=1538125 RepID=A0AAV4PS27_9ARAC|nr:hypothetical protein CDAR_540501 [Caerostris darwini]